MRASRPRSSAMILSIAARSSLISQGSMAGCCLEGAVSAAGVAVGANVVPAAGAGFELAAVGKGAPQVVHHCCPAEPLADPVASAVAVDAVVIDTSPFH